MKLFLSQMLVVAKVRWSSSRVVVLDDMETNLNIDYKKVQSLEANIVTLEAVGVVEAMVDNKEANDNVVTKNVIIVRHDLNMWHIIVIKKNGFKSGKLHLGKYAS